MNSDMELVGLNVELQRFKGDAYKWKFTVNKMSSEPNWFLLKMDKIIEHPKTFGISMTISISMFSLAFLILNLN